MKKLSIFLAFGFLLFINESRAQQDPQYTQYMYNMNVVNPAYAGSRGTLSFGLLGRTQWTSIDGAPRTLTFNAHAPIGKNVGMGISAIADEIGPAQEQNVYADFSYTLATSDVGRLAFGLKAGVTLLDVNLLGVVLPETGNSGDPVFDENINDVFPNFGAGVFYYTNKWYAGFSVPNILKSEHLDKDNINTKASEEVHYFLTAGFSVPNILKSEHLDKDNINTKASEEVHYFLTAGYVFDLSSTLKFKPSLMFKGVTGAPVSFDVNANFLLYDRLELGASYRWEDAVSALINIGVTPDFRIGYAYDYTISEFSNARTGGSHEIILLYDLDLSKKNIKSPRFF